MFDVYRCNCLSADDDRMIHYQAFPDIAIIRHIAIFYGQDHPRNIGELYQTRRECLLKICGVMLRLSGAGHCDTRHKPRR